MDQMQPVPVFRLPSKLQPSIAAAPKWEETFNQISMVSYHLKALTENKLSLDHLFQLLQNIQTKLVYLEFDFHTVHRSTCMMEQMYQHRAHIDLLKHRIHLNCYKQLNPILESGRLFQNRCMRLPDIIEKLETDAVENGEAYLTRVEEEIQQSRWLYSFPTMHQLIIPDLHSVVWSYLDPLPCVQQTE
jgi:hypothetical protein